MTLLRLGVVSGVSADSKVARLNPRRVRIHYSWTVNVGHNPAYHYGSGLDLRHRQIWTLRRVGRFIQKCLWQRSLAEVACVWAKIICNRLL